MEVKKYFISLVHLTTKSSTLESKEKDDKQRRVQCSILVHVVESLYVSSFQKKQQKKKASVNFHQK